MLREFKCFTGESELKREIDMFGEMRGCSLKHIS